MAVADFNQDSIFWISRMRLEHDKKAKECLPLVNDILLISCKNPIVHACIQCWRNGDCTWEQAMMHAVKALAELDKVKTEQLMKLSSLYPEGWR